MTAAQGRVAGIVLAGGRSSRMGRDKARLSYRGRHLVDWMADMLRAGGATETYVSSPADRTYPGHRCIADASPDAGPVGGILSVVTSVSGYDGYLVVPVDMPLLTPEMLARLMRQRGACHYAGTPLPAFLPDSAALRSHPASGSVKALLATLAARPVPLAQGDQDRLVNGNTQREWAAIQTAGEQPSSHRPRRPSG